MGGGEWGNGGMGDWIMSMIEGWERVRLRENNCCFSSFKFDEYNGQDHNPHYLGPDGYPGPSNHITNEPFTTQEIRLMRQVSGFGFRIIGGKEEGSQVRVAATCTCNLHVFEITAMRFVLCYVFHLFDQFVYTHVNLNAWWRHGFESHLSAAFSLEKVVSDLVLCCVALSFSLSEHLYLYVHVCVRTFMYIPYWGDKQQHVYDDMSVIETTCTCTVCTYTIVQYKGYRNYIYICVCTYI